ncbi:hypothetical protein [Helicobacter typhlonius]|uniref:hypothetical protein n=1 Tax=Helicobacter typhlonius TaxID=76936 RepID=UPI002FE202D6
MKHHNIKSIMLLLFCINISYANIDIYLEDEINFTNSQGVVSANVMHSNQQFQAFGTYKLEKDLKVVFVIDRIMKGQKLSLLEKKPQVTKRIKSRNSKLVKGTKLTLKGENQKEFRDFAEQIKQLENGSNNTQVNRNNKMPSTQGGGSGGNPSGSSGGSIGNISVGSGGSNGSSNIPYAIPSITTTTTNPDGSTSTKIWSSQFCEVPEFLENAIKLSVVDKDGSCVEKMAVRDDTKCEYRYDFANGKAIKQTQFYYVDNESKVQNVGDCVDLVGAEYQAELYKDDTRCSLENTEKDYGGGKGTFFVTQILFRGIDGLIKEATDCIAYGNVKEELVEHITDDTKKEAQRVVNQYYIDPYTQEKIYITKGVRTDAVFKYVESPCGEWQMDDTLLQGKKRTQIAFYDNVEYAQFNVTSCDFSTQGGKKSEYILPYQNLSSTYKEQELSREAKDYSFTKEVQGSGWTTSNSWQCGFKRCSCTGYKKNKIFIGQTKWTTDYVTKDVTAYDVYLRPDGTEYKKNLSPNGETFTRIDREMVIHQNNFNLPDDWFRNYEIKEGFYENKQIQQIPEFNQWVQKNYQDNATCQNYSVWNPDTKCGDGSITCTKWFNYIMPK